MKRFLIDNEEREEVFISEHPKSKLAIISTDYLPVVEIVYAKPKGKARPDNETIPMEEFISVKGITALGNQLTKKKIKDLNLLEPLPYESPEEIHANDVEVVEEKELKDTTEEDIDQTSLF